MRNPYEPGAGVRPLELVGHDEVIADFEVALARLEAGRSATPPLITGPRGSGKTVLLNELVAVARERGWVAAKEEVGPSLSLPALIAVMAHESLREMSVRHRTTARLQRAFGVLKAFSAVSALGVTLNIDAGAVAGTADSGLFERDLRQLFVELGETARERGVGVLLAFDEMHALGDRELDSLDAALHRTAQEGLPVAIVGAGLFASWQSEHDTPDPRSVSTYSSRMYVSSYVRLSPLSDEQSRTLLRRTAELAGGEYADDALAAASDFGEGNPWVLQLVGSTSWELAQAMPIDGATVEAATRRVQAQLDRWFLPRVLRGVSPAAQSLLAELAAADVDVMSFREVLAPRSRTEAEIATELIVGLARSDLLHLDFSGPLRDDFRMSFSVPRLADHLRQHGRTSKRWRRLARD